MAARFPVKGILFYFAFATGGLWYGAKGTYLGVQKLAAGGYAGQTRDLVIDVLAVLIQLGIGLGLSYVFVRAMCDLGDEPEDPS
jgi:hypothetical protein